jgi:membrane associated rhomboid family serine protease
MDRETKKFWRQQRRQMLQRDRRMRGGWHQGSPITITLIGLMVVGWLIEMVLPSALLDIAVLPGGRWLSLLVATVLPSGLLGLLFSGLFVWIVGPAVESVAKPVIYLLIFFGGGIVGGLVTNFMGSNASAGYAAFGLAGAYVYLMSRINQRGAMQWALLLLVMNAVFSGFQPSLLAGEASAFVAGLAVAAATEVGSR